MKNFTLFTIIAGITLITAEVKAQNVTLRLRPSAAMGQDSDVMLASDFPTSNIYNSPDDMASIWTCNGPSCITRSVINFNISSIPSNAIITSAMLYLYDDTASTNGYANEPTYGSSNAGWIKRITSPWAVNSVTWNTQPSTTDTDEVNLLQSTNYTENYIVNVGSVYRDIINSGYNYGIELMMQQETTPYNSLIFGSSNNTDTNLHPMLVIVYQLPGCLTIRPSAAAGQDSDVMLASDFPTSNIYNSPDDMCSIWTCNGPPCITRSVINFNISSIPSNAIITSAMLYLYDDTASTNGYAYEPIYGSSNAGWVKRITSPWAVHSVTWNTQPTTTDSDEVIIPQSTNYTESYALNVGSVYQDIINSGYNYGIELIMQQELNTYNSLIFGSGNNTDTNLHPMLQICYSIPTGNSTVKQNNVTIEVYPNPATDKVVFKTNIAKMDDAHVEIYNELGQIVHTYRLYPIMTTISTSDLARGIYFYRIIKDESMFKTGKIVLQ